MEDDVEIEEAVARQIKRRREHTGPRSGFARVEDAPISLDERRALDRTNITGQLKENLNLTAKWPDIITSFCGFGAERPVRAERSKD